MDANLGTIQATGELSVIQNLNAGYSIDGNSKSGFVVGIDKTLNISNIGTVNTLGEITSSFTNFNGDGSNGSVINNSGNLNVARSIFSSNLAVSGGVIYNSGTATINNSIFKDNNSNSLGGAITNVGSITINGSSFINNRGSWDKGGAIYSSGSITVKNSIFDSNWNGIGGAMALESNDVNIINSTFTNNSASRGGSIHNNFQLNVIGSTFNGNEASQSGGAIYSQTYTSSQIVVITDSSFKNNTVTNEDGLGGAIYTDAGALTIQSGNAGNSVFSGNKDLGGTRNNDIYAYNSTLYLNAGKAGRISFDGRIDSNVNSNVLNINSDSTYNSGNIIFNNLVSDVHLNLAGGILSLGKNLNSLTTTYFNNVDYNQTGGILDLANMNSDTLTLNNFASSGSSAMYLDVDFVAGQNDKITTNTASGAIAVNGVNILTDTSSANGSITVFTDSSPTLSGLTAYTNSNKYVITAGTTGKLNYTKTSNGTSCGLNLAAVDSSATRSFSAIGDVTLSGTMASMKGTTLTIFGNNNNINSGGNAGLDISSTQTLNIFNVGSLKEDGSVKTSWNGQSDNNGGVVYYSGNLNVSDSVFSSNNATGTAGVFYGTSTSAASIINSSFISNTANGNAGAIYNVGLLNINNSVFDSNKTNTADGGAIYNKTATDITSTIANSVFNKNQAYNNGGAIINSTGILQIKSSDFTRNYTNNINSWGQGGAIYVSGGTLNLENSSFSLNGINYTTSETLTRYGGAIYNMGNLTIDDVNFDSNASKLDGGAIYNKTAIDTTSTIENSTFNKNNSYNSGGAINNNAGILEVKLTDFTGNYTTNPTSNSIGGAINNGTQGTLKISKNSVFSGNGLNTSGDVATRQGGAIYNSGSLSASDTNFDSNAALYDGGAIYNKTSADITSTINSSIFSKNKAANSGGAIYNTSGNLTITDTEFNGNYTTNTASNGLGGAIYNTGG